jgi:hypothetical protein
MRTKMPNPRALDFLERAQRHLERVLTALKRPTDWDDLTIYGFYCLEAAVMAAAAQDGAIVAKNHPAKAVAAKALAAKHGLPDVSSMLVLLNAARKSQAYGDSPLPVLDEDDIAKEIENYLDHVEEYIHK